MTLGATLRQLHADLSWVVILANAGVGLWAVAAHYWPPLRRRELWWLTIAAQLSVFVEVILGVRLQAVQEDEPQRFHQFYGFAAILFIGGLYSYRAQLHEHRYLLYGGGGLFIMGLAVRAAILAN